MGIRSKMSGNSATPNAALARLQASVRIGGKGTVRRKKKVVHKTTTTDDKRLQNTLKRLGINSIPAIEEVNLFMDQGEVIHFTNPEVQASIAANTYVIIGHAETKKLQDLFPGILTKWTSQCCHLSRRLRTSTNRAVARKAKIQMTMMPSPTWFPRPLMSPKLDLIECVDCRKCSAGGYQKHTS